MKHLFRKSFFLATIMAIAACSSSDDATNNEGNNTNNDVAINYSASISDLTALDVSIDQSSLNENETIPTDDEDYIENNTFSKNINIQFDGTSATVTGSVNGVSVTVNGADVTVNSTAKKVAYTVTGTTSDGYLKIYSENKFSICLNGLSITNPDGAPLNIQSKKRGYIVIADGTTNTLTDGTTYKDEIPTEDMKATLFSEGKMLFSGKGQLLVNANCKAGIRSDAYIMFRPGCNIYVNANAGNAIKANDAIYIKGGVINAETSAATAKAINCDGVIQISGGRTTAITTGNGQQDADGQDASGCAAIKTDSVLEVNGGSLLCKSTGTGGKGINATQGITFNKGTIKVVTTGGPYDDGKYSVSATGIKSDADITINQADIMVRSVGGNGSKGIESKGALNVNGGKLQVYSEDHALCSSSSPMTITDGYTFAMSTTGCGFHSKSSVNINGGVAIACGSTENKAGIEALENCLNITNGTLIATGTLASTPSNNGTTQNTIVITSDEVKSGTFINVNDTTCLLAFKMPTDYTKGFSMTISSPLLKQGNTYKIYQGAAVSGTTDFCGYLTSPTSTGGNLWTELSLSNIISSWQKE